MERSSHVAPCISFICRYAREGRAEPFLLFAIGGCRAFRLRPLAGRGTIGGYPLLATVITPDTWALGQVRPGQQVRFEPVTVEVAQELTRQAYAELETVEPVPTRLEPT